MGVMLPDVADAKITSIRQGISLNNPKYIKQVKITFAQVHCCQKQGPWSANDKDYV